MGWAKQDACVCGDDHYRIDHRPAEGIAARVLGVKMSCRVTDCSCKEFIPAQPDPSAASYSDVIGGRQG